MTIASDLIRSGLAFGAAPFAGQPGRTSGLPAGSILDRFGNLGQPGKAGVRPACQPDRFWFLLLEKGMT